MCSILVLFKVYFAQYKIPVTYLNKAFSLKKKNHVEYKVTALLCSKCQDVYLIFEVYGPVVINVLNLNLTLSLYEYTLYQEK